MQRGRGGPHGKYYAHGRHQEPLLGEASLILAFKYLYLKNLYGDVLLVLATDYVVSGAQARTPKANVRAKILLDLLDTQKLLPIPAL